MGHSSTLQKASQIFCKQASLLTVTWGNHFACISYVSALRIRKKLRNRKLMLGNDVRPPRNSGWASHARRKSTKHHSQNSRSACDGCGQSSVTLSLTTFLIQSHFSTHILAGKPASNTRRLTSGLVS